MGSDRLTIGVVAPATPITQETADKLQAFVYEFYGDEIELRIHPQCFLEHGHFAGTDEARGLAFLEYANAPDINAIWAARGGYGTMRLHDDIFDRLGPNARSKTYVGYSDIGALLCRLYLKQIGRLVHGPVCNEINREQGEIAIRRVLDFLLAKSVDGIEPLTRMPHPRVALNLTVLEHLIGTAWQPDLTGHLLMLEEVAEHAYAIDRKLFTVTSNANIRKVRGIALGRCSAIPENTVPFGQSPEDMVREWCHRADIEYMGPADIGHDIHNKLVIWGKG